MTDPRPEVEPRQFLILRRRSSGAEAAFELDLFRTHWRTLPNTVAAIATVLPIDDWADTEWCVVTAGSSRSAGWPSDEPWVPVPPT